MQCCHSVGIHSQALAGETPACSLCSDRQGEVGWTGGYKQCQNINENKIIFNFIISNMNIPILL